MGAIGGMLGTSGGAAGTGFAKPQQTNIINPVTGEQVTGAQTGVTNSLGSSDALLAALGAQGGAGNQSTVFDQGTALGNQLNSNNGAGAEGKAGWQQAGLNNGLTGLNGVGVEGTAMDRQGVLGRDLNSANGVGTQAGGVRDLKSVFGQQQATSNQLQGIANGTGPNPAQAALNQTTGQNVANQAALMAGQRGAGSNVGLIARQAAQQGAATQQQAVGQGATMQAQQELGALGQLTGQEQAMAGTGSAIVGAGAGLTAQQQAAISGLYGQGSNTVGQQQTGIGQQFNQGATMVGQQQTQLGQNAGIANNMVGNDINATGQNVSGHLGNQGQVLGAVQGVNSANVASTGNVNNANAGLAGGVMKNQAGAIGGGLQALGSMASLGGGAGGGGATGSGSEASGTTTPNGGQNGGFDSGSGQGGSGETVSDNTVPQAPSNAGGGDMVATAARGGMVGPVSSFGQFLHKGAMAQGGMTRDFRTGGDVKAGSQNQKATKGGNSYSNDKIPAVLSEKEIVLPRSVTMSKDPARSAADFVRKVMAKKGRAS